MANEKRLIRLSDAIAKIVDTPSVVAEKTFDGQYGFAQHPANILVDRQFEVIEFLKEVPEVDAMEVIHCSECTRAKHCKMRFFMSGYYRIKDPFCAAGERREGEWRR